MKPFDVEFDLARGVLICRLFRTFTQQDVDELCLTLSPLVREARTHGALRCLWDTREYQGVGDHNRTFSSAAEQAIQIAIGTNVAAGDRLAFLVPNSFAKARTRKRAGAVSEGFASENAAYLWLSISSTRAA